MGKSTQQDKKREPWEVIVLFIALVIFLLCASSCTKEYSFSKENEIELRIKGETYFTTVNGSDGYYWKITLTSNKPLSVDYRVIYQFDDANQKGMGLSHPINATSTANVAYTQYRASSQNAVISNVKLIRVDGAASCDCINN